MTLGYLGGTPDRLRGLADIYRAAGGAADQGERLRLGVGVHYFAAPTTKEAVATYPNYHDFLRPKRPGGSGFYVSREQFDHGLRRAQALMIGTAEAVTEKLLELHRVVKFDRLQALCDWGGLPADAVTSSVQRLGSEIAPVLRAAAAEPNFIPAAT